MGALSFYVHPDGPISADATQFAYFAGLDRVPWQTLAERAGSLLRIVREGHQSGTVTVPVKIDPSGSLALTTGTLAERDAPYDLLVELARGRVGQLHNQLHDWQILGLPVPAELSQQLEKITQGLGRALFATNGSSARGRLAWDCLRVALTTSRSLCELYTRQAIAVRRVISRGRLSFWLGVAFEREIPQSTMTGALSSCLNSAQAHFNWGCGEPKRGEYCFDLAERHILWCKETGTFRALGPLIDLRPQRLPPWLDWDVSPWPVIQNSACEFLASAVRRFRSRVDLWEVAGPLNVPTTLPCEEERLATFVALLVQTARQFDPGALIAVSTRQPWLEDLRTRPCQYPAPYVVDALVRARIGLDALILDVNLGYAPQGTYPRDALDWHRQLEFWGQIGVPLFIRFCAPSSCEPFRPGQSGPQMILRTWTPEEQARWTREFFLMALAKPFVHGFLWSSLVDSTSSEFPYAGLFDAQGQPKPVLDVLGSIKQEFIG